MNLLLAETRDNVAGLVTLLEFDSYEQHTNNDVIAFSKPYFNNIFIMDLGYITSDISPIYYGDTITMRGWNNLKMPFGAITDSDPILTHRDGWKYIYNHIKHTFDAYDNTGALYIHRDNIRTFGDLHIDFTIQMSHDFEIHVGYAGGDDWEFYFIAKHSKPTFGPSPVMDGDTGYDELYGYNDDPSFDNYLATDKRIAQIRDDDYVYALPISRKIGKLNKPTSVGHFDFGNEEVMQETKVYDDNFKVFDLRFVKPRYKAQMLKWSFLLPLMTRCIYPELYGVERIGETHNNRPVYEPWLIWGVFKFLFLHREIVDDDTPPIPVFDLSPNFSY